ncbi:Protein of unknown function (DUF3078) [Neolewinella xylanilytica]|uniref:DUF3078 domain-containing protein n=1 Tax=Neolewinella xylanilytica TaxID=1514080 RepID=A0A2S6I887_9BACT|nr:DUF3078 domain-containing protein [Neolewinella xylanilytica]PPK87701.1 Protein of unknown function (DUF3078) [Neolewinella xylanilytica]
MKLSLLIPFFIFCSLHLLAQEAEEIPEGWRRGAGIGLDLTQLLQINPKQGAGQNRLGFGSAVNAFAKYKMDRRTWDNTLLWQFGLQRLGSGVIAQGSADKIPFQKTIDELRFGSKYGYQIREDGNLYYSANFTFLSQLVPTYQFPDLYSGNFVSDWLDTGRSPLSKFFAPATTTFSIGLDYQPTPAISLFFSPVSSKFIIVASDSIAARGVHGNQVSGTPDSRGIYPEYEKIDAQIGALAQLKFEASFLTDDRVTLSSSLGLYTNYLRNPQNVDVDWQNGLAFAITENLLFSLFVNVFYDDDIRVQITDYDAPNGTAGLGKRVSLTEQLLITYARTF